MSEVRTGYSYIEYEGDGVTDTYSVNFVLGYLRPAFVTCQVNSEEDGIGNPIYRALTFLPGDTGMVQIGGAVPGVGESIVFRRVIPKDLLMHMYSNGSILDYPSLDESHLQLMMALQEVLDGFGLANIYTDIDMHGFKIVGVLSDSAIPDSVVTFEELQKFSADVQALAVLGTTNGSSLVGFLQSGTGAGARTVQDKLRDVVSVKDFGAVGDGVTDDTGAIQKALNEATAKKCRLSFAGLDTCRITSRITTDKEFHIDLVSCKIFIDADDYFIFATAPIKEQTLLTANYIKGATSIFVSTLSEAPVRGEMVKILSQGVDPANRWTDHTTARQYRTSEWSIVDSGSTTTEIKIKQPLLCTEAQAPNTATASLVDSYTTTLDAQILIMEQVTCSIVGGQIYFKEGMAASGWGSPAINIIGYYTPYIDTKITKGYGPGVSLVGTQFAKVTGEYSNLEDNTSLQQYGYGVSDKGYSTLVYNAIFKDTRHGYTSSALAMSFTDSLPYFLGCGRVQYALIRSCSGFGGKNAQFDTHHCSSDTTFVDCQAVNGESGGFHIRGQRVRVINPSVKNCTNGVVAFTENMSGNLMWGETLEYLTSAKVINPDISCTTLPFRCTNAQLDIEGTSMVRCSTDTIISSSGITRVIGSGRVVTNGALTTTALGLIQVLDVSSKVAPIFGTSNLFVYDGAYWNFFTGDFSTTKAIETTGNSSCVIGGKLRFTLPPGSTVIDGVAKSRNEGIIVLDETSNNAASLILGITNSEVRIVSEDGKVRVEGCRFPLIGYTRDIFALGNVGVSHTGTGARVDNVYSPQGQSLITKMQNGDVLSFKVTGTITSGGGTITIRSDGSFNDQMVIPAGTAAYSWSYEAVCYKLSGDDWRFVFTSNYTLVNSTGSSQVSVKSRTFPASGLDAVKLVSFSVLAPITETVTFATCDVKGSFGGI